MSGFRLRRSHRSGRREIPRDLPVATLPRARVLAVDDREENLRSIGLVLEDPGLEIVSARSGDEALAQLMDDDDFAVLLIDVNMPGLDGMETARLIRTDTRARQIPIIFLTAHASPPELVYRAYESGAVDYLTKPFEARVLRSKVRVFVELKRARDRIDDMLASLEAKNSELADLTARLATLNDQKDRFLGMAAHDLRSPISSVVGFLQILTEGLGGRIDPRESMALQRIRSICSFMLRLLDDLLDINKIQSGRLRLELRPVDPIQLVNQSLELHSVLADRRGIRFEWTPGDVQPSILADPIRLEQVLNNLLSNAVKFSPPDTTVRIGLQCDNDVLELTIADQGPGIPENEQSLLFKPFSRISVRPPPGERSTGLGLAIVHSIVTAHGGTIALDPGEGQGATFRVRLPIGGPPGGSPGAGPPTLHRR